MSNSTTDHRLEKYRSVSANCDHSKLTETTGNTNCCFCCKMMHVLSERAGITTTEFSDIYGAYMIDWHMKQPGFIEQTLKMH